ncbi:DUF2268 domain-containing protein [Paenibacillus sp. sptzw28]|uniref:DUF2268 domain-containing putative Zn-dependent protease n=1 Tax=Paenibacillus sp. sptzw28 TaxID=715179 RepID=UPI001C6E4B7A|nr:DUF2268 domain-containing putative Zn-dependent protease [Paenibacillus sp. sptzw28]QYR22536.1 DUF2268 domain-containing protein [Paenibacillus sp. sptzw28]
MRNVIHNTLPVLYRYFAEKAKPNEHLPRYLEWAESQTGILTIIREAGGRHGMQDYDILSAVRSDGIDILEGQQQYGLFNPSRNIEATKWCFDESERLQLDKRIEKWLGVIVNALPSSLLPDRLNVVILPADCGNGDLMLNGSGLSCYGRTPGYLFLRVWPAAGNMNRLGHVLARSLIHGIRRKLHYTESLSLGEALVMEGLAASFIQGLFPNVIQPWLVGFVPPNDWEEALSHVAGYYGKPDYNDVSVNIYGMQIQAGSMRPPEPVPLTNEELEYACELMIAQADRSEANVVAAYLYGDPSISAQGHPSFGIPHLAGFEVGYRLVSRYLKSTGIEIESALSSPWQDIILSEGL